MDQLEASLKPGSGSTAVSVVNLVTTGSTKDTDLDDVQRKLAEQIVNLDKLIAIEQRKDFEKATLNTQIAAAWNARAYREALMTGDNITAAKIAVGMLQTCGPALEQICPDIWNDLTGDKSRLGRPLLLKGLPGFATHQQALPSFSAGEAGFKQALGLAPLEGPEQKRFGLVNLDPEKMDYEALKAYMFGRLQADSTVNKVMDKAAQLNQVVTDLQAMMRAAQDGKFYEGFIEAVKERSQKLKELLNSVTEKDLQDLKIRIDAMLEASKQLSGSAKADLDKRAGSLMQLFNLFNRYGLPQYDNMLPVDKAGNPINPRAGFEALMKKVDEGGLKPSTIGNWIKDNLPLIAATALACAVAVATWGSATPLCVGLVCAVAGVAAKEVTAELLYQANKNGYTGFGDYDNKGSVGGHWFRTYEQDPKNKTTLDIVGDFFEKVALHYGKEVARDWLMFMITAGIVGKFAGRAAFGESVQNLFKTPPPNIRQLAFQAERAALIKQNQSVAGSFMREYLEKVGHNFALNLGFSGLQIPAEAGIKLAVGADKLKAAGEEAEFLLSFGVSTAIALGQGMRAGMKQKQILAAASLEGHNTLKFKLAPGAREADFIDHLASEGFQLTKGSKPGTWEVRRINAPPGEKPIIIENADEAIKQPEQPVKPGEPPAPPAKPGHTQDGRPAENVGNLKQGSAERRSQWEKLGESALQLEKAEGEAAAQRAKLADSDKFKDLFKTFEETLSKFESFFDAQGKLIATKEQIKEALKGTKMEGWVDGWFAKDNPASAIAQAKAGLLQDRQILLKNTLTRDEWARYFRVLDLHFKGLDQVSVKSLKDQLTAINKLKDAKNELRFLGRVIEDSQGTQPIELAEMLRRHCHDIDGNKNEVANKVRAQIDKLAEAYKKHDPRFKDKTVAQIKEYIEGQLKEFCTEKVAKEVKFSNDRKPLDGWEAKNIKGTREEIMRGIQDQIKELTKNEKLPPEAQDKISKIAQQIPDNVSNVRIEHKDGKVMVTFTISGDGTSAKMYTRIVDLHTGQDSQLIHVTLHKGCQKIQDLVSNLKFDAGGNKFNLYDCHITTKEKAGPDGKPLPADKHLITMEDWLKHYEATEGPSSPKVKYLKDLQALMKVCGFKNEAEFTKWLSQVEY